MDVRRHDYPYDAAGRVGCDDVAMAADGDGMPEIRGPAWARTVTLVVPPSDVDEVHESVDDLWELNADLGAGERMRFETALLELAGNVIEHTEGHERLLCELTLMRTDTSLEAVLSDSGAAVRVPFRRSMPDPAELAESGRGIAMIELLMDDFTYERDTDGNRWRMVMQLPESLHRDRGIVDGSHH